jgi:hypothetical protein
MFGSICHVRAASECWQHQWSRSTPPVCKPAAALGLKAKK